MTRSESLQPGPNDPRALMKMRMNASSRFSSMRRMEQQKISLGLRQTRIAPGDVSSGPLRSQLFKILMSVDACSQVPARRRLSKSTARVVTKILRGAVTWTKKTRRHSRLYQEGISNNMFSILALIRTEGPTTRRPFAKRTTLIS